MLKKIISFAAAAALASPLGVLNAWAAPIMHTTTFFADFSDWYVGQHTLTANNENGIVGENGKSFFIIEEEGNRYLHCPGGNYAGIATKNTNKVYMSFDFMLSEGGTFNSIARGSKKDGSASTMNNVYAKSGTLYVKNGSKTEELGTIDGAWYKMVYALDVAANTYDLLVTDMEGSEIYKVEGYAFSDKDYLRPVHIRFAPSSGSDMYFDNMRMEEDIAMPEISSITDPGGGSPVSYESESVIIKLTAAYAELDAADIIVTRKLTGENVEITNVTIDDVNVKLTFTTPLQSANDYEVTFPAGLALAYGGIITEEAVTGSFRTAYRETDIASVDTVTEGDTVSSEVTFVNSSGSEQSVILMQVVFDADGRIERISHKAVNVPSGGSSEIVTAAKPESGSVKLFAFTGWDTPVPLNNNIYITQF